MPFSLNSPQPDNRCLQSCRQPGGRRIASFALLTGAWLIQACGQLAASPVAPSANLPATGVSGHNQPVSPSGAVLRVIVRFRSAAAGDDAATLAGLSRQAQAPVRYLASVSPDTHVYRIESGPGQQADTLRTRLLALPGITSVEIDSTARPL